MMIQVIRSHFLFLFFALLLHTTGWTQGNSDERYFLFVRKDTTEFSLNWEEVWRSDRGTTSQKLTRLKSTVTDKGVVFECHYLERLGNETLYRTGDIQGTTGGYTNAGANNLWEDESITANPRITYFEQQITVTETIPVSLENVLVPNLTNLLSGEIDITEDSDSITGIVEGTAGDEEVYGELNIRYGFPRPLRQTPECFEDIDGLIPSSAISTIVNPSAVIVTFERSIDEVKRNYSEIFSSWETESDLSEDTLVFRRGNCIVRLKFQRNSPNTAVEISVPSELPTAFNFGNPPDIQANGGAVTAAEEGMRIEDLPLPQAVDRIKSEFGSDSWRQRQELTYSVGDFEFMAFERGGRESYVILKSIGRRRVRVWIVKRGLVCGELP